VIYPSADRLEKKVGNKYTLVILAAKRARQLKEGSMPLAESSSPNPLSIAMDEVAVDKITALAPPEAVERDPVLDLFAQEDPASAAVLLSSLSGDDLDLEDEDAEGAADEEEEEEDRSFLLSTDDDDEEEAAEEEVEETGDGEEAEEE